MDKRLIQLSHGHHGLIFMTKNAQTKGLLKALRRSRAQKIKDHWTRENGAGFIADDVISVTPTLGALYFKFTWGNQNIPIQELNLNETEETIKFLEKKKG